MTELRACRLLIALTLIISCVMGATAQERVEHVRAREVLKQARAVLGGEAKVNAVNAFSATFKSRLLMKNGEQRFGEFQVDLSLPDKFAKRETRNLPGGLGQMITTSLLDGEQVWFNVRTTSADVPVVPVASADPAKEQAALLQRLRDEQALYLLQILLTVPASYSVDFTYAGEAEAEDGRADVIDARGAGGFSARLFFDKESHRLLLLSYQEPAPQQIVMSRDAKGTMTARPNMQTPGATPPTVEVQWRFSDYRAEEGILVPHLITRGKGGKIDQELELKSFRVNPSFKPDNFTAKQKR